MAGPPPNKGMQPTANERECHAQDRMLQPVSARRLIPGVRFLLRGQALCLLKKIGRELSPVRLCGVSPALHLRLVARDRVIALRRSEN